MFNNERYIRQNALPEIGTLEQQKLTQSHIAVIGAGGLGCAALPYLAAAGVGKIDIFDDDTISISNLHRQPLYKDSQKGESKAKHAATHCAALNPEIIIAAHPIRFKEGIAQYNLLLDGSDNFETKTALNAISIKTKTPLISASVNQWAGQIGIFAGYTNNKPCYHCLFPELPNDARNCNEAGILGTSAGITGMYQAHLALCFIMGFENFEPGRILSFDFKSLRMQTLSLQKDNQCPHCKNTTTQWKQPTKGGEMPNILSMNELSTKNHMIIDVRTTAEIMLDPIENALHMELQTIPTRYNELPTTTLLAFVCAGNIRSVKAAQYLEGLGFNNVCVLDKFSL